MKFEMLIESFATDRDGRVISRHRRRKAHSFVQGYIWGMCANMMAEVAPDPLLGLVTDVDGLNHVIRNRQGPLWCNGALATPNPGIRIGTGSSPVRVNQTQLDAVIGEGVGAGQMNHQAQTWTYEGVVGNQATFTMTRSFINSSGSQIDVREAGLHIPVVDAVPTTYYLLAARDLASHDVPNGGAVTLTYTVRIVL